MHKHVFRFSAVVLFFVVSAALPVHARTKKVKEPPRAYTVIASVSADSITIAEGKMTKTFAITKFTEILVKGQRATLAALQPGMLVSVTMGTDPTKASRINAGDPPPAPPKK